MQLAKDLARQRGTLDSPEHPAVPHTHGAPHGHITPFLFPCQVEALLASEDYGKDLASVNNLLKKHQLLEADISAHEVSRGGPGPSGRSGA